MTRDWKPGDVQVLLSMHPSRVQEFASWLHNSGGVGSRVRDYAEQIAAQGHGAHLVVIDAEDREQVERLFRILASLTHLADAERVQAALREFANPTPPKPPEPTGLGAVVEDAKGDLHVRTDSEYAPWLGGRYVPSVGRYRAWRDIDAVKVLSEGVQP